MSTSDKFQLHDFNSYKNADRQLTMKCSLIPPVEEIFYHITFSYIYT